MNMICRYDLISKLKNKLMTQSNLNNEHYTPWNILNERHARGWPFSIFQAFRMVSAKY